MSEANKDFIHRYMAAIELGDVRVVSKMKDAERRIDLVAPPRPEPIKPAALEVRPGDEALGMPKPFDYGVGVSGTYGWREVDSLRGKVQARPYYGPIKLERVEYATVLVRSLSKPFDPKQGSGAGYRLRHPLR